MIPQSGSSELNKQVDRNMMNKRKQRIVVIILAVIIIAAMVLGIVSAALA